MTIHLLFEELSFAGLPLRDLVKSFIMFNLCACLIVFAWQKCKSLTRGTQRSSTPDLDKPSSRRNDRDKPAREWGGKCLPHVSAPFVPLTFMLPSSMETISFQETSSKPIPRVGHSVFQANSIQTLSIWPVGVSHRKDLKYLYSLISHSSKHFVTMGLRSMKWDEWIGKESFTGIKNSASQRPPLLTFNPIGFKRAG